MVGTPEHSELEIDSVISRQNVAKEGWTTYYVDGANGNDANNGLRWETAFKTIQHAVDVAESWAKIYVRSGTYAENVSISKHGIKLIGEQRDSVIIAPTSGTAITISGTKCAMSSVKCVVSESSSLVYAIKIEGRYCTLEDILFTSSVDNTRALQLASYNAILSNLYFDSNYFSYGIEITSYSILPTEIFGCRFTMGRTGAICISIGGKYSKIYNNHFENAKTGVVFEGGSSDNILFHNNFVNITDYPFLDAGNNHIYENYYSQHTNIDNGFGIATEPYSAGAGTDPRPVVCYNGWLALGLGGNTIKSVPAAGTYTHPNDTSEHDVLEFTADTQDIFISLDVSALTQPTEIREYEKIDGTNYRQISLKTYPDDFDSGTKAITIYFKQKNKDYKVTLKSTVAEGASRDIPYVYRTDGKV